MAKRAGREDEKVDGQKPQCPMTNDQTLSRKIAVHSFQSTD